MEDEYTFNGQKPGEKVIEVVPSHPYVLYPSGFRTILTLVLAIGIFLFWPKGWLAGAVLLILILVYFFNAFYSYRESVFIITNLRIFCIAQKGFFKRNITEVELSKIMDMSSNTEGLTKTMLKYGDLTVRTASGKDGGAIIVKNIANPYSVQQKIASLLEKL